MKPPPLKDDCFALPPGVHWTPVDAALDRLRTRLHCVTATAEVPLMQAAGRYLARDVAAARANPPRPNAAVDGYGFAGGATGDGVQILPLMPGRAAAGAPFTGTVPPGQAIRIKGEGMPKHGTPSEFGDLTITFTVEFPKTVDAELAKGLENLLPAFTAADLRIGAP